MERLIPIGRAFFAAALIGLGGDHFIFGVFVTGRPPAWPEAIPGGAAWAYLSGAAFVVVGTANLAGWKARRATVMAAALVFFWALLRHIPLVVASPVLSVAWSQAAKALRFVGGALAIAATRPDVAATGALSRFMSREHEFIVAGRLCVGPTLIVNGLQHFTFTGFVASLIPAWFPGNPLFWTYFGGVALIAGGIGLLVPQTARLAAFMSGLMIFAWFFIVHLTREIAGVADGIAVFEALGTAGSLFVIAGFLYRERNNVATKQVLGHSREKSKDTQRSMVQ